MTIKAFSEKYDISYTLACEAAFPVMHVATMERDRDYLESDLYKSLIRVIGTKKNKAQHVVDRYDELLKKVKQIGKFEAV